MRNICEFSAVNDFGSVMRKIGTARRAGATASLLAVCSGKHCWTSQQWHPTDWSLLIRDKIWRQHIFETEHLDRRGMRKIGTARRITRRTRRPVNGQQPKGRQGGSLPSRG